MMSDDFAPDTVPVDSDTPQSGLPQPELKLEPKLEPELEPVTAQAAFQKALAVGKPPQSVFPEVVAFPPNRETLGGTAYLIQTAAGNVLVDSPPWTETTQSYLQEKGVRWLFITQRSGMAQVKALQQALDCAVVIQEQEAYLLPNVETTVFQREMALGDELTALWTSGFSPGCACLYWKGQGGVLFTGRHLLPTREGDCAPLRSAKTFHWPRQLRSVKMLRDRFTPETLQYLCPGASIGFLRGKHTIAQAHSRLQSLDMEALKAMEIGL